VVCRVDGILFDVLAEGWHSDEGDLGFGIRDSKFGIRGFVILDCSKLPAAVPSPEFRIPNPEPVACFLRHV
jgi:hypothetical protein